MQISEAGVGQAKILQAHRKLQLPQQGKQLAMGLAGQAVASQAFFQAELHQDSEAHLFAMQHVVAGLQLGETVVHGVGCNGSAAGTPQTAHHTGGECTGLGRAGPGRTVGILQGQGTIDH